MKFIYTMILYLSLCWGFTWQFSGRTHPELNWTTMETEHFRVHFHQGIEDIAKEGASISEQVRPTLLQQMGLDDIPIIDIIFTTEDEIMNGFAMHTYTTFIWVDQNEAAIWLEDEKWLYQVVAHELQHIVFSHKIDTWLPQPWESLYSDTPGWVWEGLAEYETERWRPHRADISHKYHVLKNNMDKMDAHHDGYSKLLYWSDRFGDSTIVSTFSERDKLGLFKFEKAFKKHTGVEVKQFNEDWRRHMNTYYYGYRSQKEPLDEIGEVVSLPIKKLDSFAFSSDSSKIALLGKDDKNQWDRSLIIAVRDTAKERERLEKQLKEDEKTKFDFFTKLFGDEEKEEKKEKKLKVLWDKKEIDYGYFHYTGEYMSWSPNSEKLVYTKYHFDENQSMVYDVKIWDSETNKTKWLTQSMRAIHPAFSPDGEKIIFVSHENSVANMYTMNNDGSDIEKITSYDYETQILCPSYAPDGTQVVFAMADKDANMDLYLLEISSGNIRRITNDPAVDYNPIWHPGSDFITYTSHSGSTPNLHTLSLLTGESKQVSDVGEAIWSWQWTPKDTTIMSTTLKDVDTVRVVKVNPHRDITTQALSLRDKYTRWRTTEPTYLLKNVDPKKPFKIISTKPYRFTRKFKNLVTLPIPTDEELLIISIWTDAMARHLFTGIGVLDYTGDNKHRFLLDYYNAMIGPGFGLTLSSLMDFTMRPYDNSRYALIEEISGVTFYTNIPWNRGEHMSSEHQFQIKTAYNDRQVQLYEQTNNKLDFILSEDSLSKYHPESVKEGIFTVRYKWLNRRPHKFNQMLPKKGHGMAFSMDYANSSVLGEVDYTRFTADAFINYSIGNNVFYGRIKTIAIEGTPPIQNTLGLTEDVPIYFPTYNLLEENEVMNPRGWQGSRWGDRLVFSTLEYRLGSQKVSIAFISDIANTWYRGENLEEWIVTSGYEVRAAIMGMVIACGQAQPINDWQDGLDPETYMRLTLINPF